MACGGCGWRHRALARPRRGGGGSTSVCRPARAVRRLAGSRSGTSCAQPGACAPPAGRWRLRLRRVSAPGRSAHRAPRRPGARRGAGMRRGGGRAGRHPAPGRGRRRGAGLDPPLAALARGMVLGADEDIPRPMNETSRPRASRTYSPSAARTSRCWPRWPGRCWPPPGLRGGGRRRVAVLIALYVPVTGAGSRSCARA